MVGKPAELPVTTPVPATTEASVPLLLVHKPPPVPFASVIVNPVQTVVGPVFAGGVVFTVIGNVAKQPAGNV